MSVGPLGMAGGFAGTPLSQTQGSDVDRNQQADASQSRQARSEEQAEKAAGVGTTEEDEQVSDRDADGRRLWEKPPESQEEEKESAEQDEADESATGGSKDPSGQSGSQIDLSG